MESALRDTIVESEVKLRILTSTREIEDYLVQQGLIYINECIERDTYFQHPCRDLAASDEALRLRYRKCSNGAEYYVLAYKGPRLATGSSLKTREEIEVQLPGSEASRLAEVLTRLGFKKLLSFTKKRRIYHGRGLEASLDELVGVGFFLEIELKNSGALEELNGILEGLTGRVSMVQETYLEICLKTGRCIDMEIM